MSKYAAEVTAGLYKPKPDCMLGPASVRTHRYKQAEIKAPIGAVKLRKACPRRERGAAALEKLLPLAGRVEKLPHLLVVNNVAAQFKKLPYGAFSFD